MNTSKKTTPPPPQNDPRRNAEEATAAEFAPSGQADLEDDKSGAKSGGKSSRIQPLERVDPHAAECCKGSRGDREPAGDEAASEYVSPSEPLEETPSGSGESKRRRAQKPSPPPPEPKRTPRSV